VTVQEFPGSDVIDFFIEKHGSRNGKKARFAVLKPKGWMNREEYHDRESNGDNESGNVGFPEGLKPKISCLEITDKKKYPGSKDSNHGKKPTASVEVVHGG